MPAGLFDGTGVENDGADVAHHIAYIQGTEKDIWSLCQRVERLEGVQKPVSVRVGPGGGRLGGADAPY